MTLGHTMSDLFFPKPARWGLRGDPVLWRELLLRGQKVALPETLHEVETLLENLIGEVLERDWPQIREQEHVHHPSLDRGGMSGGHIHVATWRERLIPLLLARAKALHDYSSASSF